MSSLFRSSAIVSLLTLVSRVLGLLRDLLIAAVFGAGVATDVFFVAFLIPNIFRRIFAEGAFSKGFIPVFNQIKTTDSMESLHHFAQAVFWRLCLAVGLVVLLGVVFAPQIIPVFAQEFLADQTVYQKSVWLLRIMFPYLFFIAIAALLTGILQSYQQFTLPALGPILLNVVMVGLLIFAGTVAAPKITWLGFAVVIGGLLHVSILVLPVYRLGFAPSLNWQSHPSVRKVLMLMLPVIIGSSAIQINQIVNTQLNTSVGPGAASWFYYADRLFQFPVGMFGVAIGSVVLPRLAQATSQGSAVDFEHTLRWALRFILVIAVPSAMGLAVLADEMTMTLYQRGAFSLTDAAMTAKALMAMSLAVIGYMFVQVLSAAHYARQDTKRPAIIGVIAVGVNIIVGLTLISRLGHVATATALSVSALINAFLLTMTLPQARAIFRQMIISKDGCYIAIAASVMLIVLLLLTPDVAWWQSASQVMRFTALFGIIAAAGGAYIMTLQLTGLRLQQFFKQQ